VARSLPQIGTMRILHVTILIALSAISVASIVSAAAATNKAREGERKIADLYVVDCLLPGQVRQLGNRTYLTARRPIKTTAADCRIRGGEYVAYDRADYKSALNVWLPSAEAGDAEAQVNVGEIFERGLGGEPNYAAALIWYRKAAAQGNTRAQFNLGTLYEQGLGVEKDQLAALNWYRQAWGLGTDDLIFTSAAAREQAALRAELEAQLTEKNDQLDLLKRQLEEAEAKLSTSSAESSAAQRQAKTLKGLIAQLEEQQSKQVQQLAAMPKTREPLAAPAPRPEEAPPAPPTTLVSGVNLGRYYALLIANQDYDTLEQLNSPINDVTRAKEILEQQYGFTVLMVADGNNTAVMEAINDLNEIVKDDDNLLIFYAGHGARLTTGQTEIGYWLPANAEAPPRDTYWVPNEFVTGHLSRLKAKRVLLVVDSCYAGLLSTEPSFLLLGNDTARYSDPEFLRFKLAKKSRLLLTSGGDRPVLDGGAGDHSVFARAFLDALENNHGILSGPDLFVRVRDRVTRAAAAASFDQRPELKTIKAAGHEVGDFFFVPKS
jgi:hypothetical protein